jgi:hypothetical protein
MSLSSPESSGSPPLSLVADTWVPAANTGADVSRPWAELLCQASPVTGLGLPNCFLLFVFIDLNVNCKIHILGWAYPKIVVQILLDFV